MLDDTRDWIPYRPMRPVEVHVHVTQDSMRVRLPERGYDHTTPSLMAVRNEGEVCAVGEAAQEVIERPELIEGWARRVDWNDPECKAREALSSPSNGKEPSKKEARAKGALDQVVVVNPLARETYSPPLVGAMAEYVTILASLGLSGLGVVRWRLGARRYLFTTSGVEVDDELRDVFATSAGSSQPAVIDGRAWWAPIQRRKREPAWQNVIVAALLGWMARGAWLRGDFKTIEVLVAVVAGRIGIEAWVAASNALRARRRAEQARASTHGDRG